LKGPKALARSQRPTRDDLRFARVDGNNLARALDIIVDHPFAVSDRKLRTPTEWNRRDHGVRLRVDHRRIVTAAVEREDAFTGRLVDDGVGILRRRANRCDVLA